MIRPLQTDTKASSHTDPPTQRKSPRKNESGLIPGVVVDGKYTQTAREEIANSITHGIGVVLAVAALSLLVTFAGLEGDAWRVVSFSIYGATLILLYLASALYHAFRSVRLKRFFKLLDHSAILLLIAGTYTPFSLVTLRGEWGWSIFGIIWGLAIGGIIFKALLIGRFPVIETLQTPRRIGVFFWFL